MFGTLTQIYKQEGIAYGLYRGMSINYLRAIPMVAVSFTTYELMKQMLKLDTGIKIEWSGCFRRKIRSIPANRTWRWFRIWTVSFQ